MTLEEVIEVMRKAESESKMVVRLHTGSQVFTAQSGSRWTVSMNLEFLMRAVREFPACFGAAASLQIEYTLPEVSQSLIITRMAGKTSVPEKESIESFAAHQASMAIYLSTGMLEELSRRLVAGGYTKDTPAALVYKASWRKKKHTCVQWKHCR